MDPLAHTLVGAALAGTRLGRGVPYATATLVLAANAPDLDVVAYFGGEDAGFHWRRGWSHGPIAIAVLPVVLVLLVGWWRRWRAGPDDERAGLPWRRLLALAYLGVLTHPALDWLNTYGIRLLSPFSDRWYYGDTLFIVDPWLWLLLGGGLFLAHSATARGLALWAAIAAVVSVAVLLGPVPAFAKVLWSLGLIVLGTVRARMGGVALQRQASRIVTLSSIAAATYVLAMLVTAGFARWYVLTELERRRIGPVEALMVGPLAANPFEREVVVEVLHGYLFGVLRFTPAPRLEMIRGDAGHRLERLGDPRAQAALADPSIRGFVGWVRFPYPEIERRPDGSASVWILDARYVRDPPAVGARTFGAARVEVSVSGR